MSIDKEAKSLGMSWEKEYGYSQAIKVENTIYLSGQVSHDDEGNIIGEGDMELQMRTAYENIIKLLTQYGATMENVVEETVYVTDIDAALDARSNIKHEIFSDNPLISSTLIGIERLAFPELMIEIKCTAIV